jgi:hypothetical protein
MWHSRLSEVTTNLTSDTTESTVSPKMSHLRLLDRRVSRTIKQHETGGCLLPHSSLSLLFNLDDGNGTFLQNVVEHPNYKAIKRTRSSLQSKRLMANQILYGNVPFPLEVTLHCYGLKKNLYSLYEIPQHYSQRLSRQTFDIWQHNSL